MRISWADLFRNSLWATERGGVSHHLEEIRIALEDLSALPRRLVNG
jgi:hypothetical protein